MGEALVSRLLGRLTEQLREEDLLRLGVGVKKGLESFMVTLRMIQSYLLDAQARRMEERLVQFWLDKLEKVCNEMDNVLDELSVQTNKRKKRQAAADADAEAAKNKNKKKVCIPILSDHSFCLGGKQSLISRRIRELVERLNEVAAVASFFGYQRIERSVGQIKRQNVLSLVIRDKIFGREKEVHDLLRLLLSEQVTEESGPVFIPIVGMGGIGKTALARLVYNHVTVETHFEKRIWVCVSDPFDLGRIARAMDDGFEGRSDEVVTPTAFISVETPITLISSHVENKKFLLVLDDVWTEDADHWLMLKAAFQSCAIGSRVLVTTRKQEVANIMGGTPYMMHLESLTDNDCFLLFRNFAQFDRVKDGSAKYEDIARMLVRRCRGLPLITKVLGSLMLYKDTVKEWEDVLNSKIWELQEVEQPIFQVLLTPAIRLCLLYCAVFPEDFTYDKDSLIELWMAQDYLRSEENEEKETVGQRYFEELVMRSFFQDFEKDEQGNIRWFKVHDLVHDFLLSLTKNECVILEDARGLEEPDKIHHLNLICASQELSQSSFSNCKNLHTITTLDSEISILILDLILQFKYLRMLSLNCGRINKVPTSIGSLVHLRYLCLSHNEIFNLLPNSICELYNLQTLHLISCERLEMLPEGMEKLSNLRNLHVTGCEELVSLPEVIGKLVCLRYIDLSDNGSLKNLPDSLCDLNNLQTLRLSRCVGLEALPEAIGKLNHLNHLHVDGCNKLKYLPEGIGRLRDLRYLDLSHNRFLTELPVFLCSLYGLQTLSLNGCRHLVKLPEAIGRMIGLRHLHAAGCVRLQYLPEGIGKLFRLRDIDLSRNVSLQELPSTMANLPSLRTLNLVGCDGLGHVDVRELIKDEQPELEEIEFLQEAIGRLTRILTPLGCNVSSGDENDALSIKSLGNVKDVTEAGKAELKNVVLVSLELDFDNEEDERKGDAELLDVLQPHQVERLHIAEYHGLTVPPNWMMPLQTLRHLILEEWTYCEVLPPLGKLSSLEILEMSGMHGLKKIGAEFLVTETDADQVSFPNLKQLSFRVMQNWEEWEGVDGCTIMPALSSLRINSCSLLQMLPQFLWKTSLDELVIDWCPILCPILNEALQEGKGKAWSKTSITINRITRGRETHKVATSRVEDKEEDEITVVLE